MRLLNETEYVTACLDCMVEIGFYKHEVERELTDSMRGLGYRDFIRCPKCNKKITVGDKEPKLMYTNFWERKE